MDTDCSLTQEIEAISWLVKDAQNLELADLKAMVLKILRLKNSPDITRIQTKELSEMEADLVTLMTEWIVRDVELALADKSKHRLGWLDYLKSILRDTRLPTALRNPLRPQLVQLYRALHPDSEQLARSFVLFVERQLDMAEAKIRENGPDASARLNFLGQIAYQLGKLLFRVPQHLQLVGLLPIVEERNISVETLVESYRARLKAIRDTFPALEDKEQLDSIHAKACE